MLECIGNKRKEDVRMNSFKEMLSLNRRNLLDEVIYSKFSLEMEKRCRELQKSGNEEDVEKIKQIEDRNKKFSKVFANFDTNVEGIYEYDVRRKINLQEKKEEINPTDAELQCIIKKIGNELYEKIGDAEGKALVLERMLGSRCFLEDFDRNFGIVEQRGYKKSANEYLNLGERQIFEKRAKGALSFFAMKTVTA